jgi:hypothetical protein
MLEQLVDLERYPLLAPGSARYRDAIDAARADVARMGAAELPGFLSPRGLALALADARGLAKLAYRSGGMGTAYLELPDASWPAEHPRKHFARYDVGVVAYDQFPGESPIRRLYEADALMAFVGAVLERGPLYRYADPFGALNLAVMRDGDQLQWHFDQTDFVVSLALEDCEEGGDFEVAPKIRSREDERYGEVGRVLRGESGAVVRLPMQPGTLLIFEGRNSVHRVSPLRGPTDRLVALLAYDTKPGTTSSPVLRMARYGRAG